MPWRWNCCRVTRTQQTKKSITHSRHERKRSKATSLPTAKGELIIIILAVDDTGLYT